MCGGISLFEHLQFALVYPSLDEWIVFQALDKDNDGYVDVSDLVEFFQVDA